MFLNFVNKYLILNWRYIACGCCQELCSCMSVLSCIEIHAEDLKITRFLDSPLSVILNTRKQHFVNRVCFRPQVREGRHKLCMAT
jgi:hypothetical protein